ncbi:HPr family phosphocarrier protein [Georgenia thermotolerans]|uniref:Phosphocarrier protein HPr n=1 Tax=Georgenia thermotolerans TaxID=527326 RepID=A0A7J5UM69_9MICO|nr:HPr family phosphocarrier protein [Georgenia thermotolerans]KAE8763204.1 HPr family phosphocarrier protein [Georgenia thermotolerans]
MAQRSAVVASKVGLHARPAAVFVKAVADSGVPVTIAKGAGEPVDATSILGVMTLGADHGDEVTLTAEGEGAEEVLDRLVDLLTTDLDA